MNVQLVLFYLEIKNYIINFLKYLVSFIYSTKDVLVIQHDKIVSVYHRYIFIYTIMMIKIVLIQKLYDKILDLVDIESESVKVILNKNYVDRNIICENKDMNHTISHMIEQITTEKEYLSKSIQLPDKYIITECLLLTTDNKNNIDLKPYINTYNSNNKFNNTIRNIFLYENILYDNESTINMRIFKNGIHNVKLKVIDMLDKPITDLCICNLDNKN